MAAALLSLFQGLCTKGWARVHSWVCRCSSACTNSVVAQPAVVFFCGWLVVIDRICYVGWMVSFELARGSCSTLSARLASGWSNGPRVFLA